MDTGGRSLHEGNWGDGFLDSLSCVLEPGTSKSIVYMSANVPICEDLKSVLF